MGKLKPAAEELTAGLIRRTGPTHTIGALSVPTQYRVDGTYNLPDRSGSQSFPSTCSASDAIADLARQQADAPIGVGLVTVVEQSPC